MRAHYKTPICYSCDHEKFPHGKTIINDPLARKNDRGEWICGTCILEMNDKIVEGMNRRRGMV